MSVDEHGRFLSAVALACVFATARTLGAQQSGTSARTDGARARLAAADSAYAMGEPVVAERHYLAVLREDPENSHAVFRLAQLAHDRPTLAVRLFRRYVALEPGDAWGYIALGDVLSRIGKTDEALALYDTAEQRAPGERDVRVGRARVLARARRVEASITLYERWVATHPEDAEAWRELATQRQRAGRVRSAIVALERAQARSPDARTVHKLRALRMSVAPWIEPSAGGSVDADRNQTAQLGVTVGATAGDAAGVRVISSAKRVGNGTLVATVYEAGVAGSWRPRSTVMFQTQVSLAVADSVAGRAALRSIPTGDVRFVWREPDRGALNVRAGRTLLAASPTLAANRVVRDEIGARGDLSIAGPVGLRGLARSAAISSNMDRNHRALVGGGIVVSGAAGELSAMLQQLEFAHPTASGYFAPRRARIVEIGAYAERESSAGLRLAVDLGAGAQQVTQWGVAAGQWKPTYRLWSELAVPIAPGRELRLELEGYDAAIASTVATTSGWHFGSALLTLRWSL